MAAALDNSQPRKGRAIGYAFALTALVAAAIALVLAGVGVYAVYVALTYKPGDSIGHVGVIETFLYPITGPIIGLRIVLFALEAVAVSVGAVLYPVFASVAAIAAWLLWKAAKRRLKGLA